MKRTTACLGLVLAVTCLWASVGRAQDDGAGDQPKVFKQTVRMVEGLRFDPPRFAVKDDDRVEVTLENVDPNDQPHNFVLIRPDSLAEIQQASMAIGPEAVERQFVPDHEAVIVASELLEADGEQTLSFELPDEDGVYLYVCTFPGHAQVMYGALYVGVDWEGSLASDPNVPELIRDLERQKTVPRGETERPTVARLFLPEAGPAAIAVALPGTQNFCWDAGNCRLRYLWSGEFADPARLFKGNGNALAQIPGDIYWRSQAGESVFGVQFGGEPTTTVDFRGYRMIDGLPEFHYRIGEATILETLSTAEDGSVDWRFRIEGAADDVRVLAPKAENVTITASVGERDGDHWLVARESAGDFTLNLSLSESE